MAIQIAERGTVCTLRRNVIFIILALMRPSSETSLLRRRRARACTWRNRRCRRHCRGWSWHDRWLCADRWRCSRHVCGSTGPSSTFFSILRLDKNVMYVSIHSIIGIYLLQATSYIQFNNSPIPQLHGHELMNSCICSSLKPTCRNKTH